MRFTWFMFILAFILLLSNGIARGQTESAGISILTDATVTGQGEQMELSIHLDSASAAYYFESEFSFDPDRLTFLDVETDTLLGGTEGISIGDMLDSSTVGISGSRTSGEGSGPGNLLRVRFRIKASSDTGIATLTMQNPLLKDSSGTVLSTNTPDPVNFHIEPRITNGGLSNGEQTIHEAQSIELKAFVFAHEVTNIATPSDTLSTWIGMSSSSADPTTWTDDQWTKAQKLRTDESGTLIYGTSFGPALPVGTWYYAARFRLNDNEYKYGGFAADTGRFWNADTAPAGLLTVEERPPYQYVLAHWNFDDADRVVDQSITANRNSVIELAGSQVDGFDQRDDGYTMATNSWHTEQGADSIKYIKTAFSTAEFQSVKVSSIFKGTSSSARDFRVQVSLDDSAWTNVNNGSFEVGDDWDLGRLDNLELPTLVNGQPVVYLRWRRIGDTRVDGTSGISSQGKTRVDNITVTGAAINPESPTVWPGDADNNGIVDVSDVLPLGTWWGLQGPDRILHNVSWTGLESIGWLPLEATFADTDGSGQVNQSDLEAIGLNFGQSWQQVAAQSESTSLPQTTIPPLKRGEHRYLTVQSGKSRSLSGLSTDLSWQSDQDDIEGFIKFESFYDSGDWLYSWAEQGKLLRYVRSYGDRWSGAWVHRGWTRPRQTDRLMRFRITARSDWPGPITFNIDGVKIARPDQSPEKINDVSLELSKTVDIKNDDPVQKTLPEKTLLHPNHPNPFNPVTSLHYQLADPGIVSLRIYSLLGREVAALVDNQYQGAGSYSYRWNASGLSSGVYLYVLKTGSQMFSGKMLLMK